MKNFDRVVKGYKLVLEGLGVDLDDPHFRDTPHRAAKAMYSELCAGLTGDPPKITVFPSDGQSQMVVLQDIPVKSLCAHHLLPFIGTATIGYIPSRGQILGLSKLSRITDYCARRPQVQEVLTNDIANELWVLVGGGEHEIGGVGVVVQARHLCMEVRGVNHAGNMVTSALRGVFTEAEVRAEFLSLAKERR